MREIDALVAERVMGETLTVPREMAMALVGAAYTRVTGPTFQLDVHGRNLRVQMPVGDALVSHPSDREFNARYFRYAVAELLTHSSEIAEIVERDIASIRITPAPYSTSISDAWRVVEKMREHPDVRFHNLYMVAYSYNRTYATFDSEKRHGDDWTEANGEHATPLAICLAALQACGVMHPSGASR